MDVAKVLIIDEQNRYLMMYRDNHPYFGNDSDLPGGTVEKGETSEFAAVRELEEEAGIKISQADLHILHQGMKYSLNGAQMSLYSVTINPRPEVVLSWEHKSYEWLSRDEFLEAAKNANDSYMHMVYAVVLELPIAWESGRESALLDAIVAGKKTIEGRLNKGKFAKYKVGDTVSLRRDVRDSEGMLRDGDSNAATVEIVAVRNYQNFLTMVTTEGFEKVIPNAANAEEAADEYNKYYTEEDQQTYGVLAIEVRFLESN